MQRIASCEEPVYKDIVKYLQDRVLEGEHMLIPLA